VDRSLGAYLQLHPAPLVVAAAQPTLASFLQVSRNTGPPGGHPRRPPPRHPDRGLQTRIRPVIEEYLLSRQAEALSLLTRREGRAAPSAASPPPGSPPAGSGPEMLAVEQGYFQPARLSASGDTLVPGGRGGRGR
jgi:hypothetical protein